MTAEEITASLCGTDEEHRDKCAEKTPGSWKPNHAAVTTVEECCVGPRGRLLVIAINCMHLIFHFSPRAEQRILVVRSSGPGNRRGSSSAFLQHSQHCKGGAGGAIFSKKTPFACNEVEFS